MKKRIDAEGQTNAGAGGRIFQRGPPLPEWEEGISDPGEIFLFAESDDQSQAFLISQMRLNDEFTAELAAAHRRNIAAVFNAPIIRRKELALLTK